MARWTNVELRYGFKLASRRLTQVLPAEGGLTQVLCETGHVPKAQVDSLTRQRMHTMSSVTAESTQITSVQEVKQKHFSMTDLPRLELLPDESCPVSDVLGRVADGQREHDAGLGADAGHTGRKLSR